jgi:hypothetical protein
MRGIKTMTGLRVLAAGHALVQNLRRGHYEVAVDKPARRRLAAAFSPTGKSNLTISACDGPFGVPDDRPTQL